MAFSFLADLHIPFLTQQRNPEINNVNHQQISPNVTLTTAESAESIALAAQRCWLENGGFSGKFSRYHPDILNAMEAARVCGTPEDEIHSILQAALSDCK
jgi:hypothetical protein